MTDDELIACYRECGLVVAKLSISLEDGFSFTRIATEAPELLEIFNLDAARWAHYLYYCPEFAHLANLDGFTPANWLSVGRRHIFLLQRIDLHSFPESAWQDEDTQWELRRYAEEYYCAMERVPIQYLNDKHLTILLRSHPKAGAYLPPEMEARGLQLVAEERAREIAENKLKLDITINTI